MTQTLSQLENSGAFIERHIGPDAAQQQEMLNAVGAESLNALIGQIVPKDIQLATPPQVGEAATEYAALAELKPSLGVTSASRPTLAWATPPCSCHRLSCATCWKPGLVHCVYAVSARSFSGAPGSAAQLPAGDAGSDRSGHGLRLSAG